MLIFRIAIAIFAILLIIFGLITAVTPIPIGLPLVFIGVLLLASAAPALLRRLRRHWRWLDRVLLAIQKRLPSRIAAPLKKSDPAEPEEDESEEDETDEDASAESESARTHNDENGQYPGAPTHTPSPPSRHRDADYIRALLKRV